MALGFMPNLALLTQSPTFRELITLAMLGTCYFPKHAPFGLPSCSLCLGGW